jgi:hypothetical protein
VSPLPTDTLTLRISEDAWAGDAQFTVSVDGTAVGGTMTASALHSSHDSNVVDLKGAWGAGRHTVQISFINDAYGGSASTDRNLYVDSIAYDGTTYAGTSAALMGSGSHAFSVSGATASATPPADTLTLQMAEDAWSGDAQFTVSIDGKTVTTPQSVTTLRSAAAWESFSYSGNLGAGKHTIGVNFVNDAYGGSATADRNLYVGGVSMDGQSYGSGVTALMSNGTAVYTITTTH